jgi:flavin-dependent dehydrogenase
MFMKPLAGTTESEAEATTEGVTYDVAIIGGGPAGSVMAALLAQQHKLKVVLMDPKLGERWIPNYGVWLEEWQGAYVGKGVVMGGEAG